MLHMYSPRKCDLSASSYFETPSPSPKTLGQVSCFWVSRLGGRGSKQFHSVLPQITLSSKTKQLLGNFRPNPCLLKLPEKLAPDTTVKLRLPLATCLWCEETRRMENRLDESLHSFMKWAGIQKPHLAENTGDTNYKPGHLLAHGRHSHLLILILLQGFFFL